MYNDADGNLIIGFVLILVFLVVYFVPSIVAKSRNVKHFAGILVLNIFLGFTLLGWVGALVWAVSDNVMEKQQNSKRK